MEHNGPAIKIIRNWLSGSTFVTVEHYYTFIQLGFGAHKTLNPSLPPLYPDLETAVV